MRTAFSSEWKDSVQPRKQRKYRYNAPQHIKGTFLSAALAKDLKSKHGRNAVRVRTGDKVKITRGQFKGKTGAVDRVDVAKERIYVAGAELVKKEGGKVPYPIHPSNVQITSLVQDKRRFKDAKTAAKKAPVKKAAPVEKKPVVKQESPSQEAKKGEQ